MVSALTLVQRALLPCVLISAALVIFVLRAEVLPRFLIKSERKRGTERPHAGWPARVSVLSALFIAFAAQVLVIVPLGLLFPDGNVFSSAVQAVTVSPGLGLVLCASVSLQGLGLFLVLRRLWPHVNLPGSLHSGMLQVGPLAALLILLSLAVLFQDAADTADWEAAMLWPVCFGAIFLLGVRALISAVHSRARSQLLAPQPGGPGSRPAFSSPSPGGLSPAARLGTLRAPGLRDSLVELLDAAIDMTKSAIPTRAVEVATVDRFSRLVLRSSAGHAAISSRTAVLLFAFLRRGIPSNAPVLVQPGGGLAGYLRSGAKRSSVRASRARDRTVRQTVSALEEHGVRVILPLIAEDAVLGFILLGAPSARREYTYDELELLRDLGVYIAALCRQQVFQDEVRETRTRAARISSFFSQHGEQVTVKTVSNRNILYASPQMTDVIRRARTIASGRQPVLITGETGTGKELIARLLHDEAAYRDEPFVALNIAAVPAALLEDELFGHARGAFTDARTERDGRVAQAGRGILFLDEIGDMPSDVQVKLLRLLQERTFNRIGDNVPREAACRFVFATHRDLEELVRQGQFREDLFYRIHVLTIALPPLRSRREDIPILIRHFLALYAAEMNREIIDVEADAMDALVRYDWPGNIRELENVVLRSLAGAEGSALTLADLPAQIREARVLFPVVLKEEARTKGIYLEHGRFDQQVAEYQAALIREALRQTSGNQSQAAELLGMRRGRLLYQMRELGIKALDVENRRS